MISRRSFLGFLLAAPVVARISVHAGALRLTTDRERFEAQVFDGNTIADQSFVITDGRPLVLSADRMTLLNVKITFTEIEPTDCLLRVTGNFNTINGLSLQSEIMAKDAVAIYFGERGQLRHGNPVFGPDNWRLA